MNDDENNVLELITFSFFRKFYQNNVNFQWFKMEDGNVLHNNETYCASTQPIDLINIFEFTDIVADCSILPDPSESVTLEEVTQRVFDKVISTISTNYNFTDISIGIYGFMLTPGTINPNTFIMERRLFIRWAPKRLGGGEAVNIYVEQKQKSTTFKKPKKFIV